MKTINQVISNPIGAIVGGGLFFYGSKKFGVTNTWAIATLTVVGIIGGAMTQKSMMAMSSTPTATTVKS